MSEKVVLEHDDLRRTLRRIAHEIAEKNPEPAGLAVVGIHTRGAVLARRLHAFLGELTDTELPIGDLDISFYRDDVGAKAPAAQPVVHASHIDFDLSERTVVLVDDVLFTGRTVRAAIEALFDYGRPRRVQLAVLCDRGHRELPIRPDYVGKNLPTARDERVNVQPRGERRRRPGDDLRRPDRGGERMKHLLAIEQSQPRGDRGDPRPRRELRRGRPPRHQEGADPARAHRRHPLLRVEHPHLQLLRARRQAPLGRPRLGQGGRLLGRQGRVAEGHGGDALRLRPGRDRDPPPLRRRRPDGRRLDRRRGRQRRRRQARAPEPGPARRLHPAPPPRHARGQADLDRRRRPPQPRRPLQPDRLPADGRRGHRLRPADPDPARDRGARLRGLLLARRDRARPTSSTRCGCSRSG